MVDNLAYTLGVGREDLNIVSQHLTLAWKLRVAGIDLWFQVAAAKGLVSGPIDLVLCDGSIHACDIPGDSVRICDQGVQVPLANYSRVCCCHQWLRFRESTFAALAGCWSLRRRYGGSQEIPSLSCLNIFANNPRPRFEHWPQRNTADTLRQDMEFF